MRKFNVTGTCIPEEDYMVDVTTKLIETKKLIDDKAYFTINRGRQYGKTTMVNQLKQFLANDYVVISISFEGFDLEEFENAGVFSQAFLKRIHQALRFSNVDEAYRESWKNPTIKSFSGLSDHITDMCENKKIVLMIDEVDKASNNRVFLGFLGILREKFLARKVGKDFTFHSVILVGVYDIRNIKLKMVQDGLYTGQIDEMTTFNSPWNIATQFNVDMSFDPNEIESMLIDYEKDHQTGMNIAEIANEIHDYTSGYPVLVSGICKYIDEDLDKDWTVVGVRRAVKLILKEERPLFDTLVKNLASNKNISHLLYNTVMVGSKRSLNAHNPIINLAYRYGYLSEVAGRLQVSNKIFEIFLTNYFIDEQIAKDLIEDHDLFVNNDGIIQGGRFNMETCLEKFAEYYAKYYHDKNETFLEREGRLVFLMFISPVLNGNGFVYMESQSADGKQTDIIVNFGNEQFIIELKIWDGKSKHEKSYTQLLEYMKKFSLTTGYLLTFNFNKNKKPHQQWTQIDENRKIFDVMV